VHHGERCHHPHPAAQRAEGAAQRRHREQHQGGDRDPPSSIATLIRK
jgi:hypothetical protein